MKTREQFEFVRNSSEIGRQDYTKQGRRETRCVCFTRRQPISTPEKVSLRFWRGRSPPLKPREMPFQANNSQKSTSFTPFALFSRPFPMRYTTRYMRFQGLQGVRRRCYPSSPPRWSSQKFVAHQTSPDWTGVSTERPESFVIDWCYTR